MATDYGNFIFGLQISFVSMCVVFIILYIISKALDVSSVLFEKTLVKSNVETTVFCDKEYECCRKQNNKQIIAVITAAAAYAMDKPLNTLKITKIVKYNQKTPIWGMVTRLNSRYERGVSK
ncbi:MAG TPA: hypothetical protein GX526_07200 [Thermoanaerobacterales bacterium]|nr:hypothetical protein [Thermoanaerobacterales bacterium]